jgi:hypothetical protein
MGTLQESGAAMTNDRAVYLSYLLRLWSMRVDDKTVWRASLESAITGERIGFASLDDLLDFLKRQTGGCSGHMGGDER